MSSISSSQWEWTGEPGKPFVVSVRDDGTCDTWSALMMFFPTWEAKKRGQSRMIKTAAAPAATCSCGNHRMSTELGRLMANHWTSAPNTGARQRHIIDALAAATVLIGATIHVDRDGKPELAQWDTEEKQMALCTSCYRHLMMLPAQLPPEQTDLTVREFETDLSALQPSIFFYMRSAARQICEWLISPQ